MADSIAKLFDVFFNRRPAEDPLPEVNIADLVARGKSTVRFKGKLYRVTVEPIDKK